MLEEMKEKSKREEEEKIEIFSDKTLDKASTVVGALDFISKAIKK
ncbi:hypothetical protein bthur0010_56370 [Bacillus thuringiensis serovar pondicheriensis BGSC 4BA1]|nr:hypothetical protein bthur0010_56370 [Bacillus thuringiensis serovar pondicheriensis BGSC 4BA1]